ncbi:MAG: hypothetical protein ABS87_11985 [Sphingomonas sp. SCN 67-18]|uniref:rhamnosyltransferase WsaF family glycosyltransferase n=1 Tax=uncultured Sphingomonas sp. TaxID=158754 RepID=UPI00086BDA5D|nr:hypothetical protein [Sphingomonas sp. SCN 67-18]ODU20124.1 MAG: hypothetical protein ABS87_11985 [Sphingomonas sp. SCN 67-18]
MQFREQIKRHAPRFAVEAFIKARARLSAPPLEDIKLHDYRISADPSADARLTLVIPSVASQRAFGGVTTGIDIFLSLGQRTGFDLRILADDFETDGDRDLIDRRARQFGLDPAGIALVPRSAQTPEVPVRRNDLFLSYNWWTTLNLNQLIEAQAALYGRPPLPLLYLIQEYEPAFYPFSSTHMLARLAFDSPWPAWGIFNSSELFTYFTAQKHRVDRSYVFEPRLSDSLRPFVTQRDDKKRQILIYGRPAIARNCFSLIEKGLVEWVKTDPAARDWAIISAGTPHDDIPLGNGQAIRSVGKLSMEDYARMLQTTAIGLSLMSSPHPSYPPLEMAHFGIRTITNSFANKDLSATHPNIVSLADVRPKAIAEALADACRAYEADPRGGWDRCIETPFLQPGPFHFVDQLAGDLKALLA